ncbi:hypothetical protein P8A22_33595 [Streptomyces laculatispora]|uniref:Uncharacterized protein n=1 Tax=Streptomyces laculatispora TaxID=887464 RepID=A0ABY9IC43_9ACTN|nr:hypothetical protein [Streptomyces laculatispora]WLQ44415.1 hypothetical protein P8A22_33595 [Streptomyces laculatispora]
MTGAPVMSVPFSRDGQGLPLGVPFAAPPAAGERFSPWRRSWRRRHPGVPPPAP